VASFISDLFPGNQSIKLVRSLKLNEVYDERMMMKSRDYDCWWVYFPCCRCDAFNVALCFIQILIKTNHSQYLRASLSHFEVLFRSFVFRLNEVYNFLICNCKCGLTGFVVVTDHIWWITSQSLQQLNVTQSDLYTSETIDIVSSILLLFLIPLSVEWSTSKSFIPVVGHELINDPQATQFDITALTSGTAYYVRVSAGNVRGFGCPTEAAPSPATPSSKCSIVELHAFIVQFLQCAAPCIAQGAVLRFTIGDDVTSRWHIKHSSARWCSTTVHPV
jgi:hypothetical protein